MPAYSGKSAPQTGFDGDYYPGGTDQTFITGRNESWKAGGFMASRPVIEERKEKYDKALEKCSVLFVAVRSQLDSEYFASYVRMVREANSLREVRKICTKVRGHFAGTMGSIGEAYAVHADGSLDIETSDAYHAALQEVWKYSSPLRWLI
ncbi:hypothetical protein [Rathayibacter toxicus]|uniref:hypothetical protein n=1 Tax=Rathayibacter toxicus TaxID=145458 RepID=UPI0011B48927|nr:hypothetical protein [Rathayibacter toxicus]